MTDAAFPAASTVGSTDQGCQWIDPEQDPQKVLKVHYCGARPLWPGRSYCEEHVWRVYQKGTAIGMTRRNREIERELAELKKLMETQDAE